MNRCLFVAFCSFFALSAYGADTGWYDAEYQQCSQNTTTGIVSCVADRTAAWDRRLNEAYQTRIARLGGERRAALRQVQRLWIRYRDANCGFYAGGGGSISRIEAAECLRVMTRERALELGQGLQQ